MNIKLILCQKVDKELKTYENIIYEIDNTASIECTIVCKVNFEGNKEQKMVLHFFLFKEEEKSKKGVYLEECVYTRTEEEVDNETDSFSLRIPLLPLFGVGNYAIEVVRNDSMEDAEPKLGPKVYADGEKLGRTIFKVK